jgi:hypothetical protein
VPDGFRFPRFVHHPDPPGAPTGPGVGAVASGGAVDSDVLAAHPSGAGTGSSIRSQLW